MLAKNNLLLALLGVWLICQAALADTNINELLRLDLEQLAEFEVVTPTKANTPLKKAPGTISVITYDEIQRSSARTIPELLRLVPGVHVRWNPMVQTIDIRSFGSNPFTSKVLLLIDGVPYNSWNKGGFPQHPGFDFFNIDNVRHLEVVRGPGSALYGENALNGVINIVTLSGEEYRQTTASLYTGSRDTQSLSLTHGKKINDDGSIFLSLRKQKTELPTELWSGEEANGTDLFLKAIYKGLQFTYYRRQDSYDGYKKTYEGNPNLPPGATFQSAAKIKQTVNIAGLEYKHMAESEAWSVKANASYANRDGSHCAGCHARTQTPAFEQVEDHGFQWQASTDIGIHSIKNMDILLGAEIRKLSAGDHAHEFSGSEHFGIEEGHIHSAEHHNNIDSYKKQAIYAQNQMTFFDEALLLTAGLRYDFKTSPELFGSELFPRLQAVLKPTENLTIRAGWNKSARYPSFTELYQDSWFFNVELPNEAPPIAIAEFAANKQLQPENLESFEFGLAYEFSPQLQSHITVFQNDVEDSIVISYGSPKIRFENHPNNARVRGLELEFKAQPTQGLSAFLNWSYQQNKQSGNGVDSSGKAIEFSYSPRHQVNAGLTYSASTAFSFTADVQWHDKYTAPSFWYPIAFGDPTVTYLDDYTYINVSAQYRLPMFTSGGKRPLTLKLDGRNLLDEKPIETLSGSDSRVSGREFFVGLEYDWTF